MSHDGAENYCHIESDGVTLCGVSGPIAWDIIESLDTIQELERDNNQNCYSCGLVRCRECIRVWHATRARESLRAAK